MDLLQLINMATWVLEIVANSTKNVVDNLAVDAVRRALAELQKVKGTDVTKAKLDELRTKPQW